MEKRSEKAAVRPDLDYFGLFDASPNPYLVLDRDMNIVGANRAYLEATKRALGDIVGRWAWDAFPTDPDTLRESIASFQRVLRDRRPDTLALLRFDIPTPEDEGGGFETRYWSIVATPVLDQGGEVSAMLQHPIDVTELQRLRDAVHDAEQGRPSGTPVPAQSGIFRRAQAVHETNRSLQAEREHLRRLFRQAPGFMCVLRGPDHRVDLANDAYLQLIGHRDVVGKPLVEALPEIVGQGFIELLDRVHRTGEPFVGRGVRLRVQRTAGAPLEESFVDFIYQPILDDGRVSGIFVQGSDVTDRVRAMDQQRLLIAELNHRVKNTLATIQSIAAQTLRSAPAPEEFRRSFQARLVALSHTHDVLTRTHWQGADLRSLLQQELSPHGASRVSLEGAPVLLPPAAALALGLVFHEMATNAAKYGALSAETGRVSVRWTTADDVSGRQLFIEWTESGGPPVASPQHRGFGSRLIERSLCGGTGDAHLDFRPGGVAARLRVRLGAAGPEAEARGAGGPAAARASPTRAGLRNVRRTEAPSEVPP